MPKHKNQRAKGPGEEGGMEMGGGNKEYRRPGRLNPKHPNTPKAKEHITKTRTQKNKHTNID